jgi:hypothetical protein
VAYYDDRQQRQTRFGIVEAVDAESAIKIAAEKFGIPDPRRRRRLVATRIDEDS